MSLRDVGLLELFLGNFSHLQCRELCEAYSGYKLSRVNLHENQLGFVRRWCRRRGLACEVSDFGVVENPRDEGKGAWRNTGRRVSTSAAIRFCYISRSARDARMAKKIESATEVDHRALGALLKIPPCCTEFYLRQREEALAYHDDDYVMLTSRATTARPPFSWQVNYLAQYIGFSLIHHFPCRWDCPATLERAKASLKIIETISPRWLVTFRRYMRGVVLVEGQVAVHLISGKFRGDTIAFRSDQVRSTRTTPLILALCEKGSMSWRSLFSVDGLPQPEYDAAELARATVVIPFA